MPNIKDQFLLDPEVHYLNFGAFGACAKPIFEEYQRLQLLLENQPTAFITKTGPELLESSKLALSAYVNAAPEDLVYITNPTFGVNIIANSLKLSPGDEVLSTNLEYGACDRTWDYFCEQKGLRYIKQAIELPILSKEHFLDSFWKGYSEKTKVIFLSHITSMTALRLPVEEICAEARSRGLITVIDGAHVPGQIPLDITALDCDFYVGACHKWMMTPKGSSFIYTAKKFQSMILPFVLSWGYKPVSSSGSTYIDYHTFIGTRDFTAFLTIPASIKFMEDFDWPKVAQNCRKDTQQFLLEACEMLGSSPLAPVNDDFILQMGSIPVSCERPGEVKEILLHQFKLELPVFTQNGNVYIRYSYNGYNSQEDLEALKKALSYLRAQQKI